MKFADLVSEVLEQTGGGLSSTANKDIEILFKRRKKSSKEFTIVIEKEKIILKVIK
jgi:hypothetical protein